MTIPRLRDIRTPEVRERVTAAAVEGVVREIIVLESPEDPIDGRNATVVGFTEPVFVVGPGTFGLKVSDGSGDVLPVRLNGAIEFSHLPGRAMTEFGFMLRMSGSEITGELDVGNILNIWRDGLSQVVCGRNWGSFHECLAS